MEKSASGATISNTMQWAAVPVDFIKELGKMGNSSVKLYLVLMAHANKLGCAWPKQETVHELTGMSVRQIQRGTKELSDMGWVSVTRRYKRSNIYRMGERNPIFKKKTFNYESYLTSSWWKGRRLQALGLAGSRCKNCGATEDLQVHHLNYDHLGAELDSDLEVLCEPCHKGKHGIA